MDFKEIINKIKDLLGKVDFGEIFGKIKPYLSKIGDFLKKTPSIFAALIMLMTIAFDPVGGNTDSSQLVNEEVTVLTDALCMGQGITTDGTYYYTSGSITAFKYSTLAKFEISTMKRVKTNKSPLPDALKKRGDDHIGGISYYNGKIYAAVEDSKDYKYPCIAVYDAESLKYITHYDVNPSRFPDGIPWVAVDKSTGYLYASAWSHTENLEVFIIDATMSHYRSIPLNGICELHRIQGGEFYDGDLYLSQDTKDNGKIRNVLRVSPISGKVEVAFTRNVGKEDMEAEGMTIYPSANGSLFHVLDYNKLVGVYVRSYAVD